MLLLPGHVRLIACLLFSLANRAPSFDSSFQWISRRASDVLPHRLCQRTACLQRSTAHVIITGRLFVLAKAAGSDYATSLHLFHARLPDTRRCVIAKLWLSLDACALELTRSTGGGEQDLEGADVLSSSFYSRAFFLYSFLFPLHPQHWDGRVSHSAQIWSLGVTVCFLAIFPFLMWICRNGSSDIPVRFRTNINLCG